MEAPGPLGWSTLDRNARLVGGAIAALVAGAALALAFAPLARAEFKFVGEWGSPTGGDLVSPFDVERDNAGNTYVVDALARKVLKYDAANNFQLSWGSFGTGPGQFSVPIAIGVNEATGEVYVADFNELDPVNPTRIERFDANGNFIGQFGSFGEDAGQFGVVTGIAVEQVSGDVFTTEQNRVQRFNSAGQFELMWGKDVVPGGGTGPETCVAGCKEGETGPAAGELSGATSIAVSGNAVYVSEDGNARISRFNATTGAFQVMGGRDVQPGGAQIGETCVAACQAALRGSGPGELDEPRGIDVNPAFGFVFIVDERNSRVQRWNGALGYISQFGAAGTGDGEFQDPDGLTENQGAVIVTDTSPPRAQRFTGLGAFQARFGDPQPKTLQIPISIAAGPGGVYVTDQNDRVLQFDNQGGFVKRFGSSGVTPGQFSGASGIAAGADGNVYVADEGNDRVQRFDSSGAALSAWGSTGPAQGQFDDPVDVAVGRGGSVYVLEAGNNNRVQRFSAIGGFEGTWGAPGDAPGQFSFPEGLATDPKGNVYVADGNNDRIQKFDADGRLITAWGGTGVGDGQFKQAGDIAVDGAGNVFVVDIGNNRVEAFGPTGEFRGRWGANGGDGTAGAGPGEFYRPMAVAVDAPGYIYVVDSFNNRVQKFAGTPALELVGKRRQDLKRLKVTAGCQSGPCNVRLSGKVMVKGGGGGKRDKLSIKLKPLTLMLNAGATAKRKLKPKKARKTAQQVSALLDQGARAKVIVRGVATNEAGEAKAKRKIKLRTP